MSGQAAAGKTSRSQPATAGRIQRRVAFEWTQRGKNNFLNFIDYNTTYKALNKNHFVVLLEADNDNINRLESAFSRHVTGYMSIDGFIELLKELGVGAASAEEVRAKIKGKFDIKLSLDKDIGDADGRPTLHVSGNTRAEPEDAKEPKGKHSARVLEERAPSAVPLLGDAAPLPTSFEEAKAQVPGLRKWVDVKREAGLTSRREGFDQEVYDLMLEHLRDHQVGLGKWATSADGMPRNGLRRIDSGALQELYSLGNPELPSDINLPYGKPTGRPQGATDNEKRAFAPRPNQKPRAPREPSAPREPRVPIPSPEEAREARRIAKRADRAARRQI